MSSKSARREQLEYVAGKLSHDLERQGKMLRDIACMIADDPAFLKRLVELIESARDRDDEAAPNQLTGRVRARNFQRIRDYFISVNNTWQTIDSLREATGRNRNSIVGVVFKSFKGEFETRDHPNDNRVSQFRLAEYSEPGKAQKKLGKKENTGE